MAVDFPSASTGDLTLQGTRRFLYNGSAFQALTASMPVPLKVQTFTASGTYTPTPGMQWAIVEVVGPGGAGGGVTGAASQTNGGGGGGAGAYSIILLTAAQIGTSQTVTIGTGGTGVSAATGNNGSGASSFGSLCTAGAGSGGGGGAGATETAAGSGGAAGTGDPGTAGQPGQPGIGHTTTSSIVGIGGAGGNTPYGSGGKHSGSGGSAVTGNAGTGYGSGGGGASVGNGSVSNAAGGAGKDGYCRVTEFGASPALNYLLPPIVTNCSLAASASGSALTISLKDASGNDPTPASPVMVPFRNATETSGSYSWMPVTAATSLVVSSGSTLGVTSSTAFRLWVVGFNDAGTFRLGVINCSTSTTIYPLNQWAVASSTAEGGAGAADSAGTFYTGTAVSSKPYTILGFIEWSSSGLTAGTWTTTNLNRIEAWKLGDKLPGDRIQLLSMTENTGYSTTSASYGSTPTTLTITPTSAANKIKAIASGWQGTAANGVEAWAAIHRGSTLIGSVAASGITIGTSVTNTEMFACLQAFDAPNTTSSTTYVVKAKVNIAGNTGLWGIGSVYTSMVVEEIMG